MKFLRTHIASKIFTVFTALVFLNMGFFLSEVKMLELDLNKGLVENLAELMLNVGMEEERDIFEDVPDEEGKTGIDFFISHGKPHASAYFLIAETKKCRHEADNPPSRWTDRVTPPPKA